MKLLSLVLLAVVGTTQAMQPAETNKMDIVEKNRQDYRKRMGERCGMFLRMSDYDMAKKASYEDLTVCKLWYEIDEQHMSFGKALAVGAIFIMTCGGMVIKKSDRFARALKYKRAMGIIDESELKYQKAMQLMAKSENK